MTHNPTARRFEIRVGDDAWAFLSYTLADGCVTFEHTFVPVEFRGQGLAGNLARAALEEARRRQWKVIPRCSYVARFIERNPQFADLVVEEKRS